MNKRLRYRIFGVGNALVDKIALVPNAFLEQSGLSVGLMTLVDEKKQQQVLHNLEKKKLVQDQKPGGSAANTVYTLSCLTSQPSVFVGKTGADKLGSFYRQEMATKEILMPIPIGEEALGMTGTSVVLTTPDGQRTMVTHLGVNASLCAADLDSDSSAASCLRESEFCYVEGYLWASPSHQKLVREVFRLARTWGIPVAFSLSDAGITKDFLRQDWAEHIAPFVDIIFANEEEALSLTQQKTAEKAMEVLAAGNKRVFLTLGAAGCLVGHAPASQVRVKGRKVQVLDTTGAGDAFAGGVLSILAGLSNGPTSSAQPSAGEGVQILQQMKEAAIVGNFVASEVVTIHGSRIVQNYDPAEILRASLSEIDS